MMELTSLGLGPINLGRSIEGMSHIAAFNMDVDGEVFIPSPGPDAWFKYAGDLSRIMTQVGEQFSASSLYFCVDKQNTIKSILLYPQSPYTEPLEDLLGRIYGPGSYTTGGIGGDDQAKNYTHYLFVSPDKKYMITYTKIYHPTFGIDQLMFHYLKDVQEQGKYNLVYRTWKKPNLQR